ncbi:unnamed protein product [Clonostachys solani]|uniref:Uncharacterized protein n=1 Tax=Clonostachys solani TaxID=160281 RepID=A0A9N9Z4Q0_9HYPO|nr:unnamed protein product [Clonostachys solani]
MVALLEWMAILVPKGTYNAFRWTCYPMHWINMTYYVAIKFTENLPCLPQAPVLDKPLVEGKRIDEKILIARRVPRATGMPDSLSSSSFDFGPAS